MEHLFQYFEQLIPSLGGNLFQYSDRADHHTNALSITVQILVFISIRQIIVFVVTLRHDNRFILQFFACVVGDQSTGIRSFRESQTLKYAPLLLVRFEL